MRYNEIQDLIKLVAKSGVSEVSLETDKVKLVITNENEPKKSKRGVAEEVYQAPAQVFAAPVAQAAAPAQVSAAPIEAAATVANDVDSDYITIKSPMIGTAYQRPSPDKDNFVNVGDEIKEGDVICIIEAMKLFNEIEAEVSGKIVKILAEDGSPVEYDQPLFLVDPS